MTKRKFLRGGWVVAAAAAVVFGAGGCGEGPRGNVGAGVGDDHGHRHGSVHGGVLVELGEHQYQLDLLHDPSNGVLTAWVMDGHVENFVRIPLRTFDVTVVSGTSTQTISLAARANGGTGESVGDTSQFQGEAAGMKGLTQFTGTVSKIEIRGAVFEGVKFRYPDGE